MVLSLNSEPVNEMELCQLVSGVGIREDPSQLPVCCNCQHPASHRACRPGRASLDKNISAKSEDIEPRRQPGSSTAVLQEFSESQPSSSPIDWSFVLYPGCPLLGLAHALSGSIMAFSATLPGALQAIFQRELDDFTNHLRAIEGRLAAADVQEFCNLGYEIADATVALVVSFTWMFRQAEKLRAMSDVGSNGIPVTLSEMAYGEAAGENASKVEDNYASQLEGNCASEAEGDNLSEVEHNYAVVLQAYSETRPPSSPIDWSFILYPGCLLLSVAYAIAGGITAVSAIQPGVLQAFFLREVEDFTSRLRAIEGRLAAADVREVSSLGSEIADATGALVVSLTRQYRQTAQLSAMSNEGSNEVPVTSSETACGESSELAGENASKMADSDESEVEDDSASEVEDDSASQIEDNYDIEVVDISAGETEYDSVSEVEDISAGETEDGSVSEVKDKSASDSEDNYSDKVEVCTSESENDSVSVVEEENWADAENHDGSEAEEEYELDVVTTEVSQEDSTWEVVKKDVASSVDILSEAQRFTESSVRSIVSPPYRIPDEARNPAGARYGPLPEKLIKLKTRRNRAVRTYSAHPSAENRAVMRDLTNECKQKIRDFRESQK